MSNAICFDEEMVNGIVRALRVTEPGSTESRRLENELLVAFDAVVVGLATRYGRVYHLPADDVAQEIRMFVVDGARGFDESLSTFAAYVAVRCRSRIRSMRKYFPPLEPLGEIDAAKIEDRRPRAERDISVILDHLDDTDRLVLCHTFGCCGHDKLSQSDMVGIYGAARASVGKRVRDVLARLRRQLPSTLAG